MKPTTTDPTSKPIAWQFVDQEEGGSVLITLKGGDKFGMPVDELVRACRSQENLAEFARQIGELLTTLGAWLNERADEVDTALVSFEPDGVAFVVVRKDKRFNPDFEDALSALDLSVAGKEEFSLIRLRALALPYSSEDTIASFLKTTGATTLRWAPRG